MTPLPDFLQEADFDPTSLPAPIFEQFTSGADPDTPLKAFDPFVGGDRVDPATVDENVQEIVGESGLLRHDDPRTTFLDIIESRLRKGQLNVDRLERAGLLDDVVFELTQTTEGQAVLERSQTRLEDIRGDLGQIDRSQAAVQEHGGPTIQGTPIRAETTARRGAELTQGLQQLATAVQRSPTPASSTPPPKSPTTADSAPTQGPSLGGGLGLVALAALALAVLAS